MSTSTAGYPARRERRVDAETDPSIVIDEFTNEVVRQLRSHLRSEANAVKVVDGLPSPAVLVKRVLEEGAGIDDPHDYAIADTALVDAIGSSWSVGKLRTELGGVSNQAVHQRVGRGTLLALPTSDGSTVYPIFQFIRRNGKLMVKPGLRKMFQILRDQDPWQVAVLLNTPAPELEGFAPVAWEKEGGDAQQLERLAEVFVREWECR